MKIDANGTEIRVMGDVVNEDAYISLTDIAKYKNPDNAFIVVANWMRNHSTISFLGMWEQIHNPNFKPIEFDRFKAESGDNAFTLTPQQWIKATDAIGIVSKSGRYGGTYAHTDIAFEFASWISPEFKLYIIKDYQRLKKDEADRLAIGWDVKRELSKINYRIHTDAVKEFLITPTLSPQEMTYTYASEADILNMALFGKTAAQWRSEKGIKGKTPNIRDFASAEELVVLINLEDTNADLIRQEVPKIERLKILREKAYRQLELLRKNQDTITALKKNAEPVQKITIVPRTMGSLGYVMQVPEEEKYLMTKDELMTRLVTLLGGRAAEEVVFDTVTTGASNDIEKATQIARAMITQYGMSEKFGLMSLETVESKYLDGSARLNCSDETAAMIDDEVKELLKECFAEAKKLLSENRDVLDEIAKYLYEKETITGKQFMEIYRKVKGIPEPVDTSHMTISEKVAESVSFNEDGSYSSTVNQAPPAPWEHPQQTEAQQPSPEQTDKDVPAQNTEKEEDRNTEQ